MWSYNYPTFPFVSLFSFGVVSCQTTSRWSSRSFVCNAHIFVDPEICRSDLCSFPYRLRSHHLPAHRPLVHCMSGSFSDRQLVYKINNCVTLLQLKWSQVEARGSWICCYDAGAISLIPEAGPRNPPTGRPHYTWALTMWAK